MADEVRYDPTRIDYKGVRDPHSRELIALGYLLLQFYQTLPQELATTPGLLGVHILQVRDRMLNIRKPQDFDGDLFAAAVVKIISDMVVDEAAAAKETGKEPSNTSHSNMLVLSLVSVAVHGIFGQIETMAGAGADVLGSLRDVMTLITQLQDLYKASQN